MTQKMRAGPCVLGRPDSLSLLGLLPVLGTPGSHGGGFWVPGTGRHWVLLVEAWSPSPPPGKGASVPAQEHPHTHFCASRKGSRPRPAPSAVRGPGAAEALAATCCTRAPPAGWLGNAPSPGPQPGMVEPQRQPDPGHPSPGKRFANDKQGTGLPAGLGPWSSEKFPAKVKRALGLSAVSGVHVVPRGPPGTPGIQEAGTPKVLSPPSPSPGDR